MKDYVDCEREWILGQASTTQITWDWEGEKFKSPPHPSKNNSRPG